MKIAVTSQDQINVTQHAGRCNRFWVYETEYADVVAKQWVELPAGTCFHRPTLTSRWRRWWGWSVFSPGRRVRC